MVYYVRWWSPFEYSDSKSNLTVGRTSDLHEYSRWKGLTGGLAFGDVPCGTVGHSHRKSVPSSQHGWRISIRKMYAIMYFKGSFSLVEYHGDRKSWNVKKLTPLKNWVLGLSCEIRKCLRVNKVAENVLVLFQVSTFLTGLANYEPASIIWFVMFVSEFWLFIILGRS